MRSTSSRQSCESSESHASRRGLRGCGPFADFPSPCRQASDRGILVLLLLASTSVAAAEPWAKEMTAFAAADERAPYPKGQIVFVGSSSIRLWDLPKSFPEINPPPLNRGFGGSQISDSIANFDLLVGKHQPRVVVMYAGDNDIAAGKDAQRVADDYEAFRNLLKDALPETRLVYIAIKPSIARWKLAGEMKQANKAIERICAADEQLTFIDIWGPMLGEDGAPHAELFVADGLHMNEQGYALWAEKVKPSLQE